MKVDTTLSREMQAASILEQIRNNVDTTRFTFTDNDSYRIYSRDEATRGVLLQVDAYNIDGRIDLSIQGTYHLGLSQKNRVSFDEDYEEFIGLFFKAY